MNDEQLSDLKQFIEGRLSQTEDLIRNDFDEKLDSKFKVLDVKIDGLREEMREGFAGVGEAIDGIHDHLTDHETRIQKLEEQRAA